jgi:hypothetical protein
MQEISTYVVFFIRRSDVISDGIGDTNDSQEADSQRMFVNEHLKTSHNTNGRCARRFFSLISVFVNDHRQQNRLLNRLFTKTSGFNTFDRVWPELRCVDFFE